MALMPGEYFNENTSTSFRVGWYIKDGKRFYCIARKRKTDDAYRRWPSKFNADFKEYNKVKAIENFELNRKRYGNMADVTYYSAEGFVEIKA